MRPNWENECVSKSALIEWLRPYLHTGDPIPADVLISDIQMMPPTLTPPTPAPPCYQPDGDGCGYQCYDGDDEPIDKCKECPLCYSDKQRHHTPPNEPERAGLYGKYTVYKNKDGSLVTDCFILRPAKDPAAVAALRAYAAATDNAKLAADIINWVGGEANERVKVMEAINNAAVAYIEGGPYENDLPGMEFALKIDRLSRDFVRPPEGEEV